jgi:hypothetical protein
VLEFVRINWQNVNMKQRYEAKCVDGQWYVWDNWRNDYLRGSQGAYGGGQIGARAAQQMADALNKEK